MQKITRIKSRNFVYDALRFCVADRLKQYGFKTLAHSVERLKYTLKELNYIDAQLKVVEIFYDRPEAQNGAVKNISNLILDKKG